MTAIYILFGAGLTVAASTAAGTLLLGRAKLPLDRTEHRVFSFLIGSALVSLLVFLLCAAGMAREGVFLAVGLLLLVAAYRWRPLVAPSSARLAAIWKFLLIAIGGAYFLLCFFNALAPEISPDGSTYHLGLVARYLREHGFHRITNDMYASFPQGIEMLFLFAFAFGQHSAAAMVHFSYLLALTAMLVLYGRRAGMAPAGVCAALIVFASPIFGVDGTSAYNDVAAACIAFGVFYLLQIWDAERMSALAIPIGLLAGFAYATKATLAVAIPYALGFVAWRSWRSRQPFLKMAITIAVCALLMMIPWMGKNWLWVHNPFSPFLNGVFPNPYIQTGFEKEYAYHMRHYEGVRSNAELPWLVTVDGRLSGFLGPLFLLAPIGLLALGRREGRQVLLAAAVFGSTYLMNYGARFLMPAAVFLALAMAIVLTRKPVLAVAVVVLHSVVSWPAVAALYCNGGSWRHHEIPFRAALRLEPEDHYLGTHLAEYRMARLIERTTPPGSRVLSFRQCAEAYTTREILVVYQSAENQVLGEILWTPIFPSYMPSRVLEFGFPREPLRAVRVVQTAGPSREQWSITDLSLIPPAPIRRFHAEPNRWEVPLAFDGKPVTRWRTAMPLAPGQFVELDFGEPRAIEGITLQCTRDQDSVRLEVQGENASGQWRTLSAAPREREIALNVNLRRASAEELKSRGVDYLLVFGSDLGAGDFKLHAREWGIRQVGELGEDRLYRIE
jgi:hypothetical protein